MLIFLFALVLSGCRSSGVKLYDDIKLNPRTRKGSLANKHSVETLLYEIWASGFLRTSDLTKEEILNNRYGIFRNAGEFGSVSKGRAYYEQMEGQRDILMLNANLFGHLETIPKSALWGRTRFKKFDTRIKATIVHELFHDFWHSILDDKKKYLFSSDAEIFFIEITMARTEEERLQFLSSSGYSQPEEVNFENFRLLLDAKEMYNQKKVFGTELYAIIAGNAFSGVIIIPRQFRKYYYGIVSEDELYKSRISGSRDAEEIQEAAGKIELIQIKELLEKQPGLINDKDRDGFTLLHLAAYSGDREVVEFLIEKGARISEEATSCAFTPLFLASLRGHGEIVGLLLAKGAPVATKDNKGRSPLHIAAMHGHKDLMSLLIQHGAEINLKDDVGMTPLHTTAYCGQKETASLLVSKGAFVKLQDSSGQTALHLASFYGDKDIVELLIGEGVDVNERDYRGETALHIAAFCGHKDVVELLVEFGAKCNIKNTDGLTPLAIASKANHKEVAGILQERGS